MSISNTRLDKSALYAADVAPLALPTPLRHRRSAMLLHWVSALLLLLAAGAVLLREVVDARAPRDWLLLAHAATGSALLLLAASRLLLRRRLRIAETSAANMPHPVLHRLAGLAHTGLYLLLLAVPTLGWALMNARGKAVSVLGLLPLPALTGRDRDLADTLQGWHEPMAWALLALIVAHVLAAAWHHYARRDAVLASMAWWVAHPRARAQQSAPTRNDTPLVDAVPDSSAI